MKIRTKLLLTLGILPILLFLFIGAGWFQIHEFGQKSTILQENYDALLLTEKILTNIKNEAISIRNMVLYDDPDAVLAEMAAINQWETDVSHDIILLEPLMNTEYTRFLMENLRKSNNKFGVYIDQVLSLIREGKEEEALVMINTNGRLIQNEIFEAISAIVDAFEANMESSLTDISRELQSIQLWSGIATAIGFIIVSGLIFRIVWMTALRLKNVSSDI